MSENLDYTVEKTIDNIELRRYPPIVVATVRGMPDNEAFRILFRYISGSNRTVSKIEMTVPVISTGQRIAMTAPVVSSDDTFSFVLPSSYSIESSPVPLDPRSTLEQIPERHVAALRFRGTAGASAVAEKRRELLETLARHEILCKGAPFLMRYNAPFTPGFMRRNEVGIELAAN
jgi:hypothetical protein